MKSFFFFRGHKDSNKAAYLHNEGMRVWREKGLDGLDEALGYFKKALELKEKLQDLAAAASSIHMIGVVYAQKHDWENARRYFLKSLEIDAGDRHNEGVIRSINDLATMSGKMGDGRTEDALLDLGNRIIFHFSNRVKLDQQTAFRLCRSLPANLAPALEKAVKQLMGWI